MVAMVTLFFFFFFLVFYGSIVAFSFFVIPYAYFYYEEYEEEGQSKSQRRLSALKYTIFSVAIVGFLFLFGLFLKPNILPPHIDLDWFRNLLTESRKWLIFLYIMLNANAVRLISIYRWSKGNLVCCRLFICTRHGCFHCLHCKLLLLLFPAHKYIFSFHIIRTH